MNNNIDQKIKKMVIEEKMILPATYLIKLNDTLKKIDQIHERRKRNVSKYKIAAILTIILIAGISISAVAAVNLYRERMEQMSEEEKAKLNEDIQKSDANADSYSREITSSERERMKQLTEQYENTGVFPQSSLLQVASTDQIDKDKVCFISETSTFYLPEHEMTDEELLEIIDFRYKRDYSITEKNQDIIDDQKKATNANSNLSKEDAENRAGEIISEILNLDTSAFEKDAFFNTVKDSKGNILSQYTVILSRGDIKTKYYVFIDAFTGEMDDIQLMDSTNFYSIDSNYKNGIEFNKELCIKNKLLVDTIVKDGLKLSQDVDKCYLNYKLDSEGKLAWGNATYAVKMKDGSGYVFQYSFNMDRIFEIEYVPDFQVYEKSEIEKKQQPGIIFKSILLE